LLSNVKEKFYFFKTFLRSPSKIGSIMPSSKFLVNEILNKVDFSDAKILVELGAGTGVVTKELYNLVKIIEKKQNLKRQVVIFEQDKKLRNFLKLKFKGFNFFENAFELSTNLKQENISSVDVILSGLPFANFSSKEREKLLAEILRCLKPGGKFIMFQYSLQMKEHLEKVFKKVELSFVLFNIPPAVIYTCTK